MNLAQNKCHGSLLRLGMELISFDSLDLFVNLIIDIYSSGIEGEFMLTDEFDIFLSSVEPALDIVKIKM